MKTFTTTTTLLFSLFLQQHSSLAVSAETRQLAGKAEKSHSSSVSRRKQTNSPERGPSGECKIFQYCSGKQENRSGPVRSSVTLGTTLFWRASWYNLPHRRTASGRRFKTNGLTAAHRWLPFGSLLLVRNSKGTETVEVQVTDRGPFVRGRDLDLSKGAARRLGIVEGKGVEPVEVTVLYIPS